MEFYENIKNILSTDLGLLAVFFLATILVILSIKKMDVFVQKKLSSIASNTKNNYDDDIINGNIIKITLLIIPFAIISSSSSFINNEKQIVIIEKVADLLLPFLAIFIIFAILDTANTIYSKKDIYKKIPFFAGLQFVKIISIIIGSIVFISVLLDKSPTIILSGLGAAMAVIMLIFKDTITGFVSGIQLISNQMLSKGDWITMPSKGVDGDVIEVGISTVKVRNFDKTISSVPTQQLTSNVFSNWTGMQNSGGRRIKRSVVLDSDSLMMLDEEKITELKKIDILHEYLSGKESLINKANKDKKFIGNSRNLTNIGTFRAYIEQYLIDRGDIHTEGFTFLVRQLESNGEGVPIQLYVFTKTTAWIEYENIMSDIFDHILSIAPIFGLAVYQKKI
jgi:miniconductance mechanosensitive channel